MNFICLLVIIWSLFNVSDIWASKRNAQRLVRITYSPKKFRSFESTVKLKFHFGYHDVKNFIGRIAKLRIYNKWTLVSILNITLSEKAVEIPCAVFALPGRYFLEYFIQGKTKTFIPITTRPVIVRNERVLINVKKNHTAYDGALSVTLYSRNRRCKPFQGNLSLYWRKNYNEDILVASRNIDENGILNRKKVTFHCNVIDTAGMFYFKYVSNYSNKTISKSSNISVAWGKYEITAQSKSIYPCSESFAIKFRAPYCDRTADSIELRSKTYKNVIDTRTAYHGFRSVYFLCSTFKTYIREHCFYYTTISSITKKKRVQATLCLPSKKKEPLLMAWSEWSSWGSCTSKSDCGEGLKFRLRSCPFDVYHKFENSKCGGKRVESKSCSLPTCKECRSCSCVLTMSGGMIISSKFLASSFGKSTCNWFINVAHGHKVKLWFDSLKLSANSTIVIRDGNDSTSSILKQMTHYDERNIFNEDIYSSTNLVSVWYWYDGVLNRHHDFGFKLSYATIKSIDMNTAHVQDNKVDSSKQTKMTFIAILTAFICLAFLIFAIVIIRIRRQRANENTAKMLSPQPISSRSSTACVSESTTRSCYEIHLSSDDCNTITSPVTNHERSSRPEFRAPKHICPRCCNDIPHPCRYSDDNRRLVFYYTPGIENARNVTRDQRFHSTWERRLSDSSFAPAVDYPQRNYQRCL